MKIVKYYITDFYNVRFMKPNMIPIATTNGPAWYVGGDRKHPICFFDKNNVSNGITEEAFSFPKERFEKLDEQCSRDCPYSHKAPNCQFMDQYRKHLDTIDFNYIMSEFERAADEVHKRNNFQGDPAIVLLVYECPRIKCAERPCLVDYFKKHNIDLIEWDSEFNPKRLEEKEND